ncbi:MROH1 protein, partial [Anhinga anhinga]|nr:MROH1 protein [Anhinga anhinga]
MDATTDKDPLVQEQIYNALCYLGESEPEEILNSCDEYLRQHDKLAYPHRVIILKAMETVVKNNIALLDKSTAKEVIRDWQQAASDVLVAVGQRFINKVMEEVLTKFQPGILPHYFVMQTFANLSVSNGELAACRPCVRLLLRAGRSRGSGVRFGRCSSRCTGPALQRG